MLAKLAAQILSCFLTDQLVSEQDGHDPTRPKAELVFLFMESLTNNNALVEKNSRVCSVFLSEGYQLIQVGLQITKINEMEHPESNDDAS